MRVGIMCVPATDLLGPTTAQVAALDRLAVIVVVLVLMVTVAPVSAYKDHAITPG